MAGIFKKAYDQADRMLNGSGLSSIVHRQGGGRYSNRDEEFSDVEGYRPYRSKFRRGLQSLPSTAKMFINALTGKEDITDKNVSKYFPKEELSVIAELPDKQEKLISEGAIRPSLGQKGNRRGQILDRGPEAELLNYSERQTDKLLRPDIFEKYGYGEEGQKKYEEWWDKRTPILSPLMDLLQAPPRYNVANTLRKFYYGAPNLAGQRRIMDEYNYHYGKPTGSIQEALQFLTDPWEQKSPDAIKWLIETIGSRAEESGDDRKVKIDITAPPPYKDGGWNFNPQTGEYIYDQGQYHPEAIDVEGYSYDPQTNVSSIDDMAIDTTSGLKHGGQTMSKGLSGINKTININGQPHSLAWINPDEASALKAMGGSGKKVGGVPAYFIDYFGGEDSTAPAIDDFSSYMDEGGADIMSGTTATEKSTGLDATRHTDPDDRQAVERTYYDPMTQEHVTDRIISEEGIYLPVNVRSRDTPVKGGISETLDPGQLEHWSYADAYNMYPGRSSDYTWRDPYPDKEKDPAGGVPYYGGSDPLTKDDILQGRYSNKLIPYINELYKSGMITDQVAEYIASLSPTTLSGMREAYDTGYSFGGPMGTMQGLSRDQGTRYAKKLKLKKLTGKETKKEKEKYLSDLKERIENLGGKFIPSHKFQGLYGDEWEDTLKSHGFADPVTGELTTMGTAMDWLKPFSMISKAGAMGLNALTSAFGVLGEFITPEGQSYRLMDDGTLVEPDIYADTDEGNVPVTRRPRPRPVQQVSVSEEVEKPLTGIAALQTRRPEVASIGPSLQAQFDNIASIFGREKAAEMLNQPVNIFA